MMWLLFLKRVCFSCFLSHEAKPPWKVSTLPHELWVHHYGQNLQDSRARHRHWVPPCLRLRKENPGCYHRFDHHTWTRRQDPAQQMGWEPGFCQVHCMRGEWCPATLQDWGIPSKKHLDRFLTYQLPCHAYNRAQRKGYVPTFLQL